MCSYRIKQKHSYHFILLVSAPGYVASAGIYNSSPLCKHLGRSWLSNDTILHRYAILKRRKKKKISPCIEEAEAEG